MLKGLPYSKLYHDQLREAGEHKGRLPPSIILQGNNIQAATITIHPLSLQGCDQEIGFKFLFNLNNNSKIKFFAGLWPGDRVQNQKHLVLPNQVLTTDKNDDNNDKKNMINRKQQQQQRWQQKGNLNHKKKTTATRTAKATMKETTKTTAKTTTKYIPFHLKRYPPQRRGRRDRCGGAVQ